MRHITLAAAAAALGFFAGGVSAQQATGVRGSDLYIVVLKDAPLAEAMGGKADLRTSATADRRAALVSAQQRLSLAAKEAGAVTLDSTQLLLNAIYVRSTPEQAEALKQLEGVARVQRMLPLKRQVNQALDLVNARTAWNQVGGSGNAGAGVRVAVLDTGIDQNHPAFKDFSTGAPAGYPKCRTDNGDCAFTNNKVIVARSYVDLLNFLFGTNPVDTRPDDNTPRDRIGHGTAGAMVVAGQEHSSPIGTISGVAPRAFLGNYKVFGSRGVNDDTYASVVIKALEDALADGMEIATLNIGGAAGYGALDAICGDGSNQPCDAFAQAIQNAVRLGLIVTIPGGNAGILGANVPALNTVESPGTAPDAITVGASTNSHIWYNTLSVLGGGVSNDLLAINARLADGPKPSAPLQARIVDVGGVGRDRLACDALPDNSLAGAFALIDRGTCTSAQKVNNAQKAGAIAVVLVGFQGAGVFQIGGLDNTAIPTLLIGFNAGQSLRGAIASQAREVRLNPDFREVTATADQVAEFSSQGPAIGSYDVKPDLLAVGTDLYMATQNRDPNGEMYSATGYTVAEGTSFASPFVAGAAALVKQRNRALSPAQVKSTLVNSGSTAITDFDNNGREAQAAVTAMGGGKLDTNKALQANVTAEPASLGFGIIPATGFPSRGIVLTNLSSGGSLNLSVRVEQRTSDSQGRITVSPSSFALLAGRQTQITARYDGARARAGKYDGFLVVTGGATEVRIPYTYFVGDGTPWNMYALQGSIFDAIPTYVNDRGILVKVIDQFGVPVRGVPVRGTVTSGNGAITFANETTDAYGIIEASFQAGSNLGQQVFRFTAGNLFAEFVANVIPRPAIATNGISDTASGQVPEAFAAGQYISIYGSGLSSTLKVFNGSELPLALAQVSVSFDNESQRISVPGRLSFVSDGQINVQIPWECQGLATVDMKVSIGQFSSAVQTLKLRAANPAAFEYTETGTNRRFVAARDLNNNVISSSNPVRRGQVAQLYLNGLGPVDMTPGSGQVSGGDPLSRTTAIPEIRIGGRPAQVTFSGLAPGIVGLYQVNATVAADASTGPDTELIIVQGGVTARTSRIAVQ